jgi:hypothetical protein
MESLLFNILVSAIAVVFIVGLAHDEILVVYHHILDIFTHILAKLTHNPDNFSQS